MKKIANAVLLLTILLSSFSAKSQTTYHFATIDEGKVKRLGIRNFKYAVKSTYGDSCILTKLVRDNESSFYLLNFDNPDTHYHSFSSKDYNFNYHSLDKFDIDTRLPAVQDGFYVNNQMESIYNLDGKTWMGFDALIEKVKKTPIGDNKKLYKVKSGFKKRYWVSNFYKGKAAVAIATIQEHSSKDKVISMDIIGSLTNEKEFIPIKKIISVDGVLRGIDPDGFLISIFEGKRQVYSHDLKKLSSNTYIPYLDFDTFVSKKTKGSLSFNPEEISMTMKRLEREGYLRVYKSSKKQMKKDLASYNFVNKDGELLLEDWLELNDRFSKEFDDGFITYEKEGKWYELSNKGKTTFEFPEETIFASSFKDGLAFIETDKGVTVIGKDGKLKTDYNSDLSLIINKNVKTKYLLNGGYGIVKSKKTNNRVIVNADLDIIFKNENNGPLSYFNDEYILIGYEKKVKAKDYSKELPDECKIDEYSAKHEVGIHIGFIPKNGTIPYDQKEMFFIKNNSDVAREIEIIFTGRGKYEGYEIVSIIAKPNQITIVKPSFTYDFLLNSYINKGDFRQIGIKYKIDGEAVD